MKVAIFSTKNYDREYIDRFNISENHALTFFETSLTRNTAKLTIGFDAVCVFVNDKVDRETIHILSENGIKVIALRCAGFNNVDLEAAKEKNITVLNVPSYSPHAVAEHTVALIMTLNRKTHKAYNRVRESNFSLDKLVGFDLYKKTVGVIGTGKIGAIFCKIMIGFGCTVLAYDTYESDDLKKAGIRYTSFNEVISESDIISLHCPLTPETKYIINEGTFSRMKNGVMMINTSRGALINTLDAIQALKNGKLGYFGIDVYEQEGNLFFKDLSEVVLQDESILRLMSFPNVLITSHQGFLTKEALTQIAITTLKNLTDVEKGIPSENIVGKK
jgi:D-lactate dehydrogenase